jgi:hypothetical protein
MISSTFESRIDFWGLVDKYEVEGAQLIVGGQGEGPDSLAQREIMRGLHTTYGKVPPLPLPRLPVLMRGGRRSIRGDQKNILVYPWVLPVS